MSRSQVNTSVYATQDQIESINSTSAQGEKQFMERFEPKKDTAADKAPTEVVPQHDPFSWFNTFVRGLAFIAGLAGTLLVYNFFLKPKSIERASSYVSDEAKMYKKFREETDPPPYVADTLEAMEDSLQVRNGKDEADEEE